MSYAQCKETTGFLFSHRCERQAVTQCRRCNRPVCAEHTFAREEPARDEHILCVTCGKQQLLLQDQEEMTALQEQRGRRGRRGRRIRQGRRGHGRHWDALDVDDMPYLYASYYYEDYGYYGEGSWAYDYIDSDVMDPNDFSEADGASLQAGEDDFEHDMGAS